MILLISECIILFFLNGLFIYLVIFRNQKKTVQDVFLISSGLSLFMCVVTGYILSLLHLFTITALWVTIVCEILIGVGITFFYYRNQLKKANFKSFKEVLKIDFDYSFLLSFFVILLIIFFLSLPFLGPSENLSNHTSWSYYFDSSLIVENKTIPKETFQWLEIRPYTVDKISFNILTAEVIAMGGKTHDPLEFMRIFPLFVIVIGVIGFWSFSRVFLNRPLSLLVMCLVFLVPFMNNFIQTRFFIYRAQALGVILMFITLYCIVKGIETKEFKLKILSALFYSLIATIHIPIALLTGFLWISLIFTDIFFRGISSKRIKETLILIGLIFVVTFAFYGSAGKFLTFMDTVNKKENIVEYNGYDPTYELYSLAVNSGRIHKELSKETFYIRPTKILKKLMADGIFNFGSSRWNYSKLLKYYMTVLIFIFTSFIFFGDNRKIKMLALSMIITFVCVYILALFFSYSYDNYIYGTFVLRRLGKPMDFFYAFLFAGFFESIWKIVREEREFYKSRYMKNILYAILSVFILFCSIGAPKKIFLSSEQTYCMDLNSYRALLWLKNNAPKNSIILCNSITGGNIKIIGECIGVLEGQLPYLRNDHLVDSLNKIYDAKGFYEGTNGIAVLKKYEVDYVLVTRKKMSLGGLLFTRVSKMIDISQYDELKLREMFDSIQIYEVIY